MRRLSFRDPPVWQLAGILMAVLTTVLLLNNFHYLFHASLYEFQDLALDSLQILKAKSFHEIHGQYSRWGFHHPGPAFFYVQAWGEMLFYDWWHLVPRPLNAQMLAALLLNIFFISVALATATHRIGTHTIFLPLAFGLGVLHVAALSSYEPELSALMLLGNWPGYFLVVPFFALLVSVASVASGRGESLPFAVLTGCFLVHGHLSQAALFVLPLSALAYVGLLLACRRETTGATTGKSTGKPLSFLREPWRRFPRSHLAAVLTVGVFLVPILIDFSRGGVSNFARIMAFRRAHANDPHFTVARSLLYFLQFGTYQWYRPNEPVFGPDTAPETWEYLKRTRLVWEFWLLGVLGALAVLIRSPRRADPPGESTPDAGASARAAGRRRYIVCLTVVTAGAVAMSLVWGCIMNGETWYLNAFVNFSIFYAGMLVIAAAATDFVCATVSPQWNDRGVRGVLLRRHGAARPDQRGPLSLEALCAWSRSGRHGCQRGGRSSPGTTHGTAFPVRFV